MVVMPNEIGLVVEAPSFHHRNAVARPVGGCVFDLLNGLGWRGRQLRAAPDDIRPMRDDPCRDLARLCRLRRRAEAVEVEQVGGGHHELFADRDVERARGLACAQFASKSDAR